MTSFFRGRSSPALACCVRARSRHVLLGAPHAVGSATRGSQDFRAAWNLNGHAAVWEDWQEFREIG